MRNLDRKLDEEKSQLQLHFVARITRISSIFLLAACFFLAIQRRKASGVTKLLYSYLSLQVSHVETADFNNYPPTYWYKVAVGAGGSGLDFWQRF